MRVAESEVVLLTGPLALRARGTLGAIARRYADDTAAGRTTVPSLSSGRAGVALFHACLPGRAHASRADRLLDLAIDAVATEDRGVGLHAGLVGIAWCVEHLRRADAPEHDPNADVDELLIGMLSNRRRWEGHFDLISGLVGLGVYALERLPKPSGETLLHDVLRLLRAMAERDDDGYLWRVPELLARQEPRWRHADLGLAHGTPGVVVLFARAIQRGYGDAGVEDRLRGAVRWLLAQQIPGRTFNRFAYSVGWRAGVRPARLAWCYGDLGIAWALLVAARALGEAAWERDAVAIALAGAQQDVADTGVVDAGVCHGAAGIAHMLHRFYRATTHEGLHHEALRWYEMVLDMYRPGRWFAGYPSYDPRAGRLVSDSTLLTGAAGVGLVLASALAPVPLEWDRAYLLGDVTCSSTGAAAAS